MFTIVTAVLPQASSWFHSPGATLIALGPVRIRYYGLMIAIGFLASLFVARKLAKRTSEELADEIDNFALVALMTGIVGARLWFVFLNFNYFSQHLDEIHQIWLGGQSIQGGIIGGLIGTFLYDRVLLRNTQQEYLHKFAILATIGPLAQAIGRWGNFFNEEAFGSVTTLPWGLYISHTGQLHHPTFLYESIGNLVIFVILLRLFGRISDAQSIGAYLVLYSCLRLVIENIRTDSLMIGSMPAASVLSLVAIIIGAVLLTQRKR